MSINILMPALSPTMEEGKIAKWLKKEGDEVKSGDVIAEIETDKATMELEVIDDGILAKVLIPEGTPGVKINKIIAVLAEDGEDWKNIEIKEDASVNLAEKSIEKPLVVEKQIEQKKIDQKSSIAQETTKRIFSSPLARRLAKENNINLANIKGTGGHGRVIKRDIEEFLKNGSQSFSSNSNIVSSMSDNQILQLYKSGEYDIVEHDSMRKVIAQRLTQSKQTVPHFYLSADCKIDALLQLRAQLNATERVKNASQSIHKISINDMVIKAVSNALQRVPKANVCWLEDAMIEHKVVNVAVAVAIDGGLITPIVANCEAKSLLQISLEMKDLIKRAKERRLKPEEYQGGSVSVSNLGMYGVKDFAAIVNPPQSAIFAISAGREVPIIDNGKITIGNIMSVTISVDHRAIDGAVAAQLMQAFKETIENPMSLLL